MDGARRRRRAAVWLAVLIAAPGCAAVWGFHEPLEEGDGGADATSVHEGGEAAVDGGGEAATDGRVDAPACSAACVPAVPTGWQGPLEIAQTMGGPMPAPPAGCDAGAYPVEAFEGLGSPDASAASCTCSCGAPSGITCTPPVANYFSDSTCMTSCGTTNQTVATTCTTLMLGTCGGTHVNVGSSLPSGGACAPDAGSTVPPVDWSARARLCAPPSTWSSAGCGAGEVCAPVAALPFETGTYCVVNNSGVVSCPPGYPKQRVFYESSTDTRACSACTCGSPTGATCTGGTASFYGSTCTGNPGLTMPVPGTCGNLGGAKVGVFSGVAPTGGSCTPMGGAPTGSFQPESPTTVCCTQ